MTSRARKSGVTKAEQSITLLGADTVAITVKSATPLTFHLGDQIDVYGKTYTLNQLPGIKKTGNRSFEYTLTFEGVQYELIDVQFLLPDDTVLDSFTGDLQDFLGILIGNLTRVYPDKWALGVFPANTEYKTLTYTEKNCLEVLQDLCEQYSTEFEITQANGVRTLNIKMAGVNFPYTFRYGRTGGLYELTRQNINSKNVVTRLYVYGGNSNLGNKYRYSRLCLPGKAKNASYIENEAAIAAYGLKENTKIFDDIRPERYGEVTAAGSAYYAFKDATMNFDLNEKDSAGNTKWLIDGATAKVKFTTGNLAGYEFDIHKYDHATKEIQVVPFTDENGMKFPSETSAAFQFGVGDKYFFTDINLPDAYKTDAENKLLAEGNKAITEYSQPQVQYGLSIDENFIRQFAGELTVVNLFAVGDYIPVEDEDIGVNKSVRITAFTRDLLREYKYNITLGDSVTKTTITRVIEDLQKIDHVIEINDLADPSKARRNWKASQEVLASVFDPEGHYYSEKIKPLSIETTMLATGARSQQFVLQNTRFEPNYEGDPNTVKVAGGMLVHYTIAEAVKSWQLNTATFSDLASGTAYYIYARCQRAGSVGNIVFDTVQRTVDGDPTYYYFLIGSLSSAMTDAGGNRPARLIALTYGATTINGRFITTGRIESAAGGKTYFDLDKGEIGGKIVFSPESTTQDGTTIIEGGKLNSTLVDADRIVAKKLDATEGTIADFTIQGNRLVGQNGAIIFQNAPIETLDGLINNAADPTNIPLGDDATTTKTSAGEAKQLDLSNQAYADIGANYIEAPGMLFFSVSATDSVQIEPDGNWYIAQSYGDITCQITKVAADGSEVVCDSFAVPLNQTVNRATYIPSPGNYKIRVKSDWHYLADWGEYPGSDVPDVFNATQTLSIKGQAGGDAMIFVANQSSTQIGTNGFYSYWGENNYLYYGNTHGFEVRIGNYGIKVNNSGLMRWNGAEWEAM